MRWFAISLGLVLLTSTVSRAKPTCTLVVRSDTGEVVLKEGPCEARCSPASTFKVPLAVIGFDAGVLVDAHTPAWPYREEYRASRDVWKQTVDPTSWLRDSVVWYSQVLVKTLGPVRFQHYVDLLDYGNRDLSGKPANANRLPPPVWVSSTLKISPIEQVAFLRKLVSDGLPVSPAAARAARSVVPEFPLGDGWIVHGKTGSGHQPAQSGVGFDPDRQFGWFVGWAGKSGQIVVFARLIQDDGKIESPASFRARDGLLAELPRILDNRLGPSHPP